MSNISPAAQERLNQFNDEFNALIERHGFDAACLVLVPSVTIAGYVSFQSLGDSKVCALLDNAVREYNERRSKP